MTYAATTKVPVDRTRAEIEAALKHAKATRTLTMDEPDHALVMCALGGRLLRFKVPIAAKASDQERRSRWRALGLVIKAKLESVASQIETAEEAWLAHVVMPDGRTVSEWVEPEIVKAIDSGKMPSSPLMIEGPR
jgi:hypothetical protein